MRKLKWIVVGAMLITVISVLVGCGAAGVILVQEVITEIQ